jgi:hypothetical protein
MTAKEMAKLYILTPFIWALFYIWIFCVAEDILHQAASEND